jgi:uncharacterized damage-inducible protein DinB
MIGRGYVQRMARYNRWQIENLYGAADRLPEAERQRERGAFFGSIEKLNHLLWSNQSWMSRTHHRGQVHCMLTAAGAKPSDTDLPFLPD